MTSEITEQDFEWEIDEVEYLNIWLTDTHIWKYVGTFFFFFFLGGGHFMVGFHWISRRYKSISNTNFLCIFENWEAFFKGGSGM